jgi:hypothetical protein
MTQDWWSHVDPDRLMEEAMGAFAQERRKLGKLAEAWDEHTEVRAKNRALVMTFDGRGEVLDLKFLGETYRTLAPAELASTIMETMRRGRSQCAERISEVVGTDSPAHRLNGEKFDPVAMVDELIGPMMQGLGQFGLGSPLERGPKGREAKSGD